MDVAQGGCAGHLNKERVRELSLAGVVRWRGVLRVRRRADGELTLIACYGVPQRSDK